MRKSKRNYESEVLDIIETRDWDRAKKSNDKNLHRYIIYHKDTDENCRIVWEHIKSRDFESEILEIVETKDWDRVRYCNDVSLYFYVKRRKDTNESCKIIWEHIKPKDHESEISDIIRTKNWDRARWSNDTSLYQYILYRKDTDKNCRIVWEHIRPKKEKRDYESEVSEIIETKDWNKAKRSNDRDLYSYIHRHKDTDENCRIMWEHIHIYVLHSNNNYDYESVVSEIVETKNWSRAKKNRNIYAYIYYHKNTNKNCEIIWKHIKSKIENHSIKKYLLYYFKNKKPARNNALYDWFYRQIKKSDQCCIDVKNLIVASENFQDPVALETLDLIKKHLEKEDT